MHLHRLRYATIPYYDLRTTCHMHGWRHLAPFAWDEGRQTLTFACLMDGAAVDVTVSQHQGTIQATVHAHRGLPAGTRTRLRAMIRRSLSLDVDTTPLLAVAERLAPALGALVRQGAGRLLRSPTLWEDAVKTLCTTNCSWVLTERMCAGLCGPRFSPPTPLGQYPFPAPARVAAVGPARLRRPLPIGYRAPALHALARTCARDPGLGGLGTDRLDAAQALARVRAFPGFGPYASAHLLLLADYCDAIPVDSAVTAYVRQTYRTKNAAAFLARRYRGWRPFRWWGYRLERMWRRQTAAAS